MATVNNGGRLDVDADADAGSPAVVRAPGTAVLVDTVNAGGSVHVVGAGPIVRRVLGAAGLLGIRRADD